MILLANIALLAWPVLAVVLFGIFKPARALIVGAVLAVLFMPNAAIQMHMVPYAKITAIPLGLLLGALVMDSGTLFSFRPNWVDLPVCLFVLVPLVSGLFNGFSPYDSFAAMLGNFIVFGIPYLLGRIYLRDVSTLRQLALAVFYGGLVYVPLCLIEIRIGPELHLMLYGFRADPDYEQSMRGGGFRPEVFLQHGLMLGLFMSVASLCGVWLWFNKASPRSILRVPTGWCVLILVIVTVFCHSAGSLALLVVGLAVLFLTRGLRTLALALLLTLTPLIYMGARTFGTWDGENLARLVADIDKDRADSLRTRFGSEAMIVQKAMQKPWLGWGPMGAQQVYDETDKTKLVAIPDGMWESTFGGGGWVGLAGAYGMMLLPAFVLMWRYRAKTWRHPAMAAPVALAMVGVLYALDNLMNNMVNPIYYLAMGAVTSFAIARNPAGSGPGPRQGRPIYRSQPVTTPRPSAEPRAQPTELPDDFFAPGTVNVG